MADTTPHQAQQAAAIVTLDKAEAIRDSVRRLADHLNAVGGKLSMLRTTLSAFQEAAMAQDGAAAKSLHWADLLDVLAMLLPDDEPMADELSSTSLLLMEAFPMAHGYPGADPVEPPRVPPAQLLVDALKAASGHQADPKKLLFIGDELFGYADTEYIAVADAFSAALERQGWTYDVAIQRGKKAARLVRAEAPSSAASKQARKRDRLAEVAR